MIITNFTNATFSSDSYSEIHTLEPSPYDKACESLDSAAITLFVSVAAPILAIPTTAIAMSLLAIPSIAYDSISKSFDQFNLLEHGGVGHGPEVGIIPGLCGAWYIPPAEGSTIEHIAEATIFGINHFADESYNGFTDNYNTVIATVIFIDEAFGSELN